MTTADAVNALLAISDSIKLLDKEQLLRMPPVQMVERYNAAVRDIRQQQPQLSESLPPEVQVVRRQDWPARPEIPYVELLARCQQVLYLFQDQGDPKRIGFSDS